MGTWNDVVETLSAAPAGAVTLRFAQGDSVILQLPADDSLRANILRPLQPFAAAVIGEISPGSPAAKSGLRPGDRIVSADGAPVTSWSAFVDIVRAHPGRPPGIPRRVPSTHRGRRATGGGAG